MRIVLFLFTIFLSSQLAVAQPPEYFVDNWYLHSFYFNGEEVFINTLGITQGPTLIIQSDYILSGSSFCNTYSGNYEYIENGQFGYDKFIPRNIVHETEDCGNWEEMEAHFFLPFDEEKTAEIYDVGLPGDPKEIVLQYDIGYQIYKNIPALNTLDISIKDMIIFPNPARNKLIINSAGNEFDSIIIEDIQGRIVMKMEETNSKEINVSNLKSGLYFVTIFFSNSSREG